MKINKILILITAIQASAFCAAAPQFNMLAQLDDHNIPREVRNIVKDYLSNDLHQVNNFNANHEKTLLQYSATVTYQALLSQNRLASGSNYGEIKIWDINTGKCLKTLIKHIDRISKIIELPGNKLASASWDEKIIIWDLETGQDVHTMKEHNDHVVDLLYLGKNLLISGALDGYIKIWDTENGNCAKTLVGDVREANCIIQISDCEVAFANTPFIQIYNLNTKKFSDHLQGHNHAIFNLKLLSNDRLVSGSIDKTAIIWDLKTGNKLHVLKGHNDFIDFVSPLHNERLVTIARDGSVRIWSFKTGECLHEFKETKSQIKAFSIIGKRLVAGGDDGKLYMWDIDKGKCILSQRQGDSIETMVYTENGELFVGLGNGKIKKFIDNYKFL